MSIESEIRLLTEKSELKAQLEMLNPKNDYKLLNELQLKDQEINKELQKLQELWIISNLFKEIKVNLDLNELETCFVLLNSLRAKIDDYYNDNDLKNEIKDEYLILNDSILDKLKSIWRQLMIIEPKKLIFNIEVEINDVPINYETILKLIQDNNLVTQLNANISHIIDQSLITPLINGSKLSLHDNVILITQDAVFDDLIPSIYSLVNFISQIPNNNNIINYINNRLFQFIRDKITNNIDTVYNSQEKQKDFIKLSGFLSQNEFKRNDLTIWIQYELNDIIIQNLVDLHVGKIRDLFSGLKHSALRQLVERDYKEMKEIKVEKESIPNKKETYDDDGWGWGDEDIEFDDDKEASKSVEKHPQGEFDEDWDAWDDQEEEEVKPKKHVSRLTKGKTPPPLLAENPPAKSTSNTAYKTTKIPDYILEIIESYLSTQSKLPEDYRDTHFSKLNYVASAYYILALEFFNGHELLLFNDLVYLNSIKFIPRLNELANNLLSSKTKSYKLELRNQYDKLQGLNPELNSDTTFGIIDDVQNILSAYFTTLEPLAIPSESNVVEIIDELYNWIILDIFSKHSIGEDESEYLSSIIQKFLSLKTPITKPVSNHTRLKHIEFILKSHLKDIMDGFYNAEFFDLSTNELIKLIDALFADSALKRNSIQEIKEIREAE